MIYIYLSAAINYNFIPRAPKLSACPARSAYQSLGRPALPIAGNVARYPIDYPDWPDSWHPLIGSAIWQPRNIWETLSYSIRCETVICSHVLYVLIYVGAIRDFFLIFSLTGNVWDTAVGKVIKSHHQNVLLNVCFIFNFYFDFNIHFFWVSLAFDVCVVFDLICIKAFEFLFVLFILCFDYRVE